MDFQGFQSALSPFFVVLLVLALIVLSFYSYRNQKNLSSTVKIGLSSLRLISFLVLIFLALNPFFFSSTQEIQPPKFLFLFDNSESVSISKGEYSGINDINTLIQGLELDNLENAEIDYFSLDGQTKQIQSLDSLTYQASESNFINAINQIQELEDDYTAAVLISDGIITFGRNPIISASNLSIPIYTIGLGDTSRVRDITINNIVTNETGYTNTRHIVDVEISQNGFENTSTLIGLYDSENSLIVEESIEFTASESVTNKRFEIDLLDEGITPFRFQVQPLNGEWSTENNSRTLTVDVLDSKTRILHLATEVHPDVKFIRTNLATDPSIELQTLTWLGDNRFVEQNQIEFDDLDLIILHGNPNQIINPELSQSINRTPTLYLDLPGSRRNISQNESFALTRSLGSQTFEMSILPNSSSESHPILDYDDISYGNLAPIISSIRTNIISADAIALLNTGFQGIDTQNPLLAITERGDLRRAHVSAWGWYRLSQSPSEDERNFTSQLFTNIVSWASNNPDNRRLKISPTRSSYNTSEKVTINASLNNESGAPEPDATIEIHIKSDDSEERIFNLDNLGGGNYSLTLDALNAGIFSFTATARKDNRVIDEQNGEFIIQDSNNELINIIRNDELLNALANETGGSYSPFNNIDSFWDSIDEAGLLQSNTVTVENYQFPIRSVFWFIMVLFLLGTEWVLRKYYSLP